MASAQPSTNAVTGPVTRKRRQLEEQEEKRRAKEEMAKKVRKNTKTSFIEVDRSTGKVKIEVKQEQEEEEQNVVIVKEEVDVPMDIGGPEDLGGNPLCFQQSAVGASENEFYPENAVSSQVPKVSVGVDTDLLASHFVSLEEFNKLKEEMRREKEESDKRFRALEAGFQALMRKFKGNLTLTPKDDQPVPVDMVQEEEPGSALPATEKFNGSSDADLKKEAAANNAVGVPGAVLLASSTSENCAEPEDDRTLALFPEVMEVIWNKYKYSMFNKTDFLKSRLICSTWRQGIDEIGRFYGNYGTTSCPSLKEKRNITLINGQFLWKDGKGREFGYDPDNGIILDSPIQPTQLTIENAQVETTTEERDKSRKSIEEFLKKCGHGIKKFIWGILNDSHQFEDKEDMQQTFSLWLSFMPNLEDINFSGWGCLELDQFPKLSKLKSLSDLSWPIDLFKTAIFNNPQISSLKVGWIENFNFKGVLLPQLRDLDLYENYGRAPFDLNLLALSELHAPLLEKLRLDTVTTLKHSGQVKAIYEVLNKFRESLQFLQIRVKIDDGEMTFPVMLRLTQLVFEFDLSFSWYDFDIGRAVKYLVQIISSSCPSLEHLVMAAPPTRYSADETRLDKIHTRKRVKAQLFSKLKLWEALPSVKKVEWIYPFYADEDQKFVFIRNS